MNEVMQWYERDMTLAQAMDGIETNMWASVRNYIAVGFYLKAIRDRKLFQEAGYQNFEEFVRDKYDRDKGWASRCIKVNDQLSKDGNSLVLAEEYREYKVSQLVELAYLTEEQRTLANPDMTVKQLQAIRKPEPQQEKEVVTLQPELKEHEGELKGKVVTSQLDEGAEREPEVIHFTAGNRTIDNAYGATIAAVVRAYLDAGYSRPEKECEVTAFGLVYKVLKRQDVTVFYPDSGRTVFDIENVRLEEEYQYWHGTKAEPELVTSQVESEPGPQDEEPEPEPELPKSEQAHPEKSGKCIHRPEFDCTMEEAQKLIPGTGEDCGCKCCWECVKHGNCEWECNSSERRPAQEPQQPAAKEQQNEEIYCENENQEETAEAENEPSDVALLRGMLEKEKEFLDEMIKVDKVEPLPPKLFREKKILVAALAGMLSDLEEPETEEPKQPALPVMKNNDQRKAWLRDYQSWGLWYTDEHIGARYYKYDFENGVRLIVEEYSNYNEFTGKDYTSSYLHLVGGPEPTKHPMHGYGKWNRHETYDRYPDSETELVEFLKEIQKCSDAGAISTRRLMRNI